MPAAAESAEVLELDDVAAADQAPTHERTASAAFYGEAFDDDPADRAAGRRTARRQPVRRRAPDRRATLQRFLSSPTASRAGARSRPRRACAARTMPTSPTARGFWRVASSRPAARCARRNSCVATTGAEFLDALVAASRSGPIANLVVYGHAAPNALFMREDRGFYGTVMEVAKVSRIVSGEDDREGRAAAACGRARPVGFRATREPRRDPLHAQCRDRVRGLRGRGKARHRTEQHREAHGRDHRRARSIASVDVTDQSMGRGRDFRNMEYSRRTLGALPGRRNPRCGSTPG